MSSKQMNTLSPYRYLGEAEQMSSSSQHADALSRANYTHKVHQAVPDLSVPQIHCTLEKMICHFLI